MNGGELKRLREVLRFRYPGIIGTPEDEAMWAENFRSWPFRTIKDAAETYMATPGNPAPSPRDILMRIPKGDPTRTFSREIRIEDINGRKVRSYQCQRCRDLGIVMWYDADLRPHGSPCDCPAGNCFYSFAPRVADGAEDGSGRRKRRSRRR